MALFRLVLLVGIVIGLMAIALQNQTPLLSLAFLGQQSQVLPLGMLIIGAIALGMVMGLLLWMLLQVTAQPAPQQPSRAPKRRQSRSRVESPSPAAPGPTVDSSWDQTSPRDSVASGSDRDRSATADDWGPGAASESARTGSDWDSPPADWGPDQSDWGAMIPKRPPPSSPRDTVPQQPQDTRLQDKEGDRPQRPSQSPASQPADSTYSYNFRDSKFNAGTSQRESVYDAEYRMLTPPYKQPKEEADWNDFEDEFPQDQSPRS